jgi:hypothetical protein
MSGLAAPTDESSGTASIGGQYANNTVLFNHGQGGAVYIHNVTDGSLTVTGQFLNNVANEVEIDWSVV